MTLTTTQALVIAGAVTLGTIITRFLPFLLFPDNKPIPKVVEYLGRTLPAAMMGLLVVYCLRNVDIAAAPHGLPERCTCGSAMCCCPSAQAQWCTCCWCSWYSRKLGKKSIRTWPPL